MVYLTYAEYTELGGTLPQSDFTLLEFKCRKRIDKMTDCRVQRMANAPEAVKLCIMSLIPIESKAGVLAQIENPTVTSYNTDGYSESYGKALGADDAENSMTRVISTTLYGELDDDGVPLLYRGVV
ncbi:MAG: hypothetical protein PHS82_03015 [Lachnospiraceae bacterium]|nr:hypothetical protein [Lachnospiraceae bacterium]